MIQKTNTVASCTYTSSGDYSTYTKNKAFDGNSTTYWVSLSTTSPKTIGITFPSVKKMEYYGIKIKDTANYSIEENAPVSWTLQVLEGGSWYTIHEVVDYSGFVSNVESLFPIPALSTHKNYQLVITKQKGLSNQVMITEIILYADMDKIDTSINAVYSSSGDFSAIYKKDYVFDNFVTQNQWVSSSSSTKWIQVDLTKGVFPTTLGYRVTRYGILPGNVIEYLDRAPKSWILEGYVGGAWVKLDEVTGFDSEDFADDTEEQFIVGNPKFATKYRLTITETNGAPVVSLRAFTLYEQPNFGNLVGVGNAIVSGIPKPLICWMPETQLTYTTLQVIRKVYSNETVIATFPYADRMKVKSFIDSTYTNNGQTYPAKYWIKLLGCSDGQTHESIRIEPSRIVSTPTFNGTDYIYTVSSPILYSIGGIEIHNRFNNVQSVTLISGSTTMNSSGSTQIYGSTTVKTSNDKKSSSTSTVSSKSNIPVDKLAASTHNTSRSNRQSTTVSTHNTSRSNRQSTTVSSSHAPRGPYVHSLSNLEDNRLE